jgi:hypothetical protein
MDRRVCLWCSQFADWMPAFCLLEADVAAPVRLQVRGATTHYDAVVGAATSGVLNASTDTGALRMTGSALQRMHTHVVLSTRTFSANLQQPLCVATAKQVTAAAIMSLHVHTN